MQFKDYPVGWSEIEHSAPSLEKWRTFILKLPNGKNKLMGYRKNPYGRKNGHWYWCYLGFCTKSLDKLKNHVLNKVRNESMEIINFVEGLKND